MRPLAEDETETRRALTHYAPYDAPKAVVVQAICGRFIHRDEHQMNPTCPNCQDILAAYERATACE